VVLDDQVIDQLQRRLDAVRMALVAVLAVINDEQFRSVKAALAALEGLSETCHGALEELSKARGRR
jgi:hypothetical protein